MVAVSSSSPARFFLLCCAGKAHSHSGGWHIPELSGIAVNVIVLQGLIFEIILQ